MTACGSQQVACEGTWEYATITVNRFLYQWISASLKRENEAGCRPKRKKTGRNYPKRSQLQSRQKVLNPDSKKSKTHAKISYFCFSLALRVLPAILLDSDQGHSLCDGNRPLQVALRRDIHELMGKVRQRQQNVGIERRRVVLQVAESEPQHLRI